MTRGDRNELRKDVSAEVRIFIATPAPTRKAVAHDELCIRIDVVIGADTNPTDRYAVGGSTSVCSSRR